MRTMRWMLGMAGITLLAVAAVVVQAEPQTYKDVALVDVNCSTKAMANPDAHTRECALKCAGSGFGIVTGSKFVKFDAAGNKQVTEALKGSDKKDHLRVDVSGDLEGDTLKVSSVKLL